MESVEDIPAETIMAGMPWQHLGSTAASQQIFSEKSAG